ncbi:MAG: methionyl-tRNA formyltransferase [Acidimicrobiales bacterium]|nr:methionyl-tRNA formyltransferase [Acidimicrobiales bacterium]
MPAAPLRPRRVAFLGSPDAAVPTLAALVAGGFDVAIVVTQPDRRRGRGSATAPTPVKAAAEALGLPVAHTVDDAVAAGVDIGVVVAFGELITAAQLDALPMVNVHFSLLPRWRGAAPVERALLAGDDRTGVCVMEVVEALDAGGVYASTEVPIGPRSTAAELRSDLAERGAELLVECLAAGLGEPVPQDGEVTYAKKITSADLRLDWSGAIADLDRRVRVGGAWTTFRGARLRVLEAHPGPDAGVRGAAAGEIAVDGPNVVVSAADGRLVLDEVQPEGKPRRAAAEWARGARLEPGERLGLDG